MYAETTFNDIDMLESRLLPRAIDMGKTDREIYSELKSKLQQTDFFKPDPMAYVFRGVWVVIFGGLAYTYLLTDPNFVFRVIAAAFLGFLCVQSASVAHESAHGAVTRNRKKATYIGRLFMNLFFGSSYAFWKDKHGQHHKKPNSSDDSDIRPGLFNFTLADAKKSVGVANVFTRYQHFLIWPLSSLMGFMFKIGSLRFLMKSENFNKLDMLTLLIHYLVWLVPSFFILGLVDTILNYFLITWFAGMHLSFIFITNHLGNPCYDEYDTRLGILRQAATARNISANPLLTSLCSGLNSHIEHHLFPYVPFTRLAIGRKITRQVMEKYGVRYHQTSLFQAFHECYIYNKKMAMAARLSGK